MDKTRDPVNQGILDIRDTAGVATLGLMNNQVWHDDPRRLLFTLARYKFVAKMLSGRKSVLEVGCGDAFCSRVVRQEVAALTVTDYDPLFIEDIESRKSERWPMTARVHDMLAGPADGTYDAAYALDVLEHIAGSDENRFLDHLKHSLTEHGVLIIGMPSIESQAFASPASKAGHVNCKTGADLKALMERHFHTVFLFSMNDEVVHTGFARMAHYLIGVCAAKKPPVQD